MAHDAEKLSLKVEENRRVDKKYPWEPDTDDFDEVKVEEKLSLKDIIIIRHDSRFR